MAAYTDNGSDSLPRSSLPMSLGLDSRLRPSLLAQGLESLPRPSLPKSQGLDSLPRPSLPTSQGLDSLPRPSLPMSQDLDSLPRPSLPTSQGLDSLPRPPLPKSQLYSSYLDEIYKGRNVEDTLGAVASRNNNATDPSQKTRESFPAPRAKPTPYTAKTVPSVDPSLALSPEKGLQTDKSFLRDRNQEKQIIPEKGLQTNLSFLRDKSNQNLVKSQEKNVETDGSCDQQERTVQNVHVDSTERVSPEKGAQTKQSFLKGKSDKDQPHVHFSDNVETWSISPRFVDRTNHSNITGKRTEPLLPSHSVRQKLPVRGTQSEGTSSTLAQLLKSKSDELLRGNNTASVVTGLPTRTVIIGGKENNRVNHDDHVLARPEFNSILNMGKQIKDLEKTDIDAIAKAEEKLQHSTRTRTQFTEKVLRKVNVVGDQFKTDSLSDLINVDCDVKQMIGSVEQERSELYKSSIGKVAAQPTTKHRYNEPDVMKYFSMASEEEGASLSLHSISSAEPERVTADPRKAFSLYRHARCWENLPSQMNHRTQSC